LLSNGPIACARGVPSLIVFIPCNDVCPDEQQCTHKVIMFDDARAVSVGCFVQADVNQLQLAGAASQVRCEQLASMPPALATVVTCPPPTKTSAALMKALAASVEDRLLFLTDWAKQTLGFLPAAGATKHTFVGQAETSTRLRTEDGEPITDVHSKLG
jgi:hypothetical protein